MRRISILVLILSAYFVTAAWSQQAATKPPIGRHLQHRMASQASRTPGLTVSRSFSAQANPDHAAKVWELGTYPGGTWFATWHINDFGVIVGLGDLSPIGDGPGYTHTLAVPLFGPHAGEWYDLGTLSEEQPMGWQEPLNGISDTGLVASHSTASDGQAHAVAWTRETGMVDLGTLKDTGDPRYSNHNSSAAYGTNKLGTLIVGGSGVDGNPEAGFQAPVVWTPSKEWVNGKFVTKWEIHKLDTTGFPDLTWWMVSGVNDYGQIIGTGRNDDFTIEHGLLWNPRAGGKGWKLMSLSQSLDYPFAHAYDINERGEIIGIVLPSDVSAILPVLWKPIDRKRTMYSPAIMLPLPEGGFSSCFAVGINDPGDMVGDCWDEAYTKDLPTRWSTKDLTFSEIIDFPADWGFAWGVNDNRIATVTYTGGEKCSAGIPWWYTCGGAIQLH
jgi:probable HAF family extracellular repeat protein